MRGSQGSVLSHREHAGRFFLQNHFKGLHFNVCKATYSICPALMVPVKHTGVCWEKRKNEDKQKARGDARSQTMTKNGWLIKK